MRGILIDPKARTVTEVEVARETDGTTLASMYAHLECDTVELVRLETPPDGVELDLWIDEEGLFAEEQHRFYIAMWGGPLTGRGLLLSHDREGASTECPFNAEMIKDLVRWCL